MAISHLKCRECEATYPLDARYACDRCFGPLEVAYDHSQLAGGDVAGLRRRIQAGPQNLWRYADFLPLAEGPPGPSGRLTSRVGLPAGCTPLIRADRLAQRLGLGEVWVKNDAANPTHSFKDRVVSVAAARARELGFQTIACASTGNLAGSVAAYAAALGLESYVFIPARSRGAEGALDGRLRHAPRRRERQLRRRQPLLHGALGRARVGVRERQPASLLRRGLEDARVRDRRAARFRAAGPLRSAGGVGVALHEGRKGLRGVARARAARGRAAAYERRPGRGLLAGRAARSPRAGTSARPSSPRRSRSRSVSATRPTAPTRWTSRAAAAVAWTR